MSAWKDFERRVCRALGSNRRGQVAAGGWARGSDDDGTGPFSVECKRTVKYQLRKAWIEQARRQGKEDVRPWLLVIGEHNDRRPIAVMDFADFVMLAKHAGLIHQDETGPLAVSTDSSGPVDTTADPSMSNVTVLR